MPTLQAMVCMAATLLLVLSGCKTPADAHIPTYDNLRAQLDQPGTLALPAENQMKQPKRLPAPGLDGSLSLSKAKEMAIGGNPDLKTVAMRIEAARARIQQAMASYWPSLDATAGTSLSERSPEYQAFDGPNQGNELYQAGLSLSWVLFDGYARDYRVMQARYQFDAAEASRADAQRLLIKAISQTYLSGLRAQKSIAISQSDKAFNTKLLDDAEKRFKAGSGAETDVLNFQIGVDNAQIRVLQAEQQRDVAMALLAELIGYPKLELPPLASIPLPAEHDPVMNMDLAVAAAQALEKRPDIQQIMAQIQGSMAAVGIAKADYLPTVVTSADAGFGNDEWEHSDEDLLLQWGASATWNLFSGGRREAAVTAAKREVDALRFTLESQWQTVVSEIRQELINLDNIKDRIALQKKIADNTKKIRDKEEKAYKAGSISLTRLNEVQLDLIIAEERLAQNEIELLLDIENLQAAIGSNTQLSAE